MARTARRLAWLQSSTLLDGLCATPVLVGVSVSRAHSATSRQRRRLVLSAAAAETEAYAADGRQERLARCSPQLSAQVPDVDIHNVALGIEMHVPHFLQKRGTADDLPRMKHEILEELELLRREVQGLLVERHHMVQSVQYDRAVAQHIEPLSTAAPMQRADSGQ